MKVAVRQEVAEDADDKVLARVQALPAAAAEVAEVVP